MPGTGTGAPSFAKRRVGDRFSPIMHHRANLPPPLSQSYAFHSCPECGRNGFAVGKNLTMDAFLKRARRFIREEEGPTSVEYATLLGLIAAGVLVALSAFGDRVYAIYLALHTALPTADAAGP